MASRMRALWWPRWEGAWSRCGVYRPSALGLMRAAAGDARLTVVVEGLDPVRVPVPAGTVRSVNTPHQLAEAEAELAG